LTGVLFAGSPQVGLGGLGYAITYANNQMETAYMFALVFAATMLGFVFFFIVMFLEWTALHNWHESKLQQTAE
jgi:NitT/TauT family transport system permease protein